MKPKDNHNEAKKHLKRKKRDESTVIRRSPRACDRCRRTKNKCIKGSVDVSCDPCIAAHQVCTFSGPASKRGPTKGYLHTLEVRCHSVEALVGILLSIPDQRAVSLLAEISEDPYARNILATVNGSSFGFNGRSTIISSLNKDLHTAFLDPFDVGPTNAWQDTLVRRLSQDPSKYVQPFGSSPSMSSIGFDHCQSSNASSQGDLEPIGSASGELTISENNQIRFRGKSSGLQLLEQSQHRISNPRGGEGGDIRQIHDIKSGFGPSIEHLEILLPSVDTQIYLLQLFQDFTYPSFPILDQEQLWVDFYAMTRGEYVKELHYFKLLLLSIYSITAQQVNFQEPIVDGIGIPLGQLYFERAKHLLDSSYNHSHPIVCQATLLLALREFGYGGLTQAWLYSGMAIRMALDLGLNISSESWTQNGEKLFTERERESRERIWFGCIHMDKYMSLFIGRPVTIRKSVTNLLAPTSIDSRLEYTQWPATSYERLSLFPVSPGRISSSWNANCSLSLVTCEILVDLYSVGKEPRSDVLFKAKTVEMEHRLQEWANDLPDTLRLDTQEQINAAPAHILGLHMQKECAVTAVQVSIINLRRISTFPQDMNSTRALAVAIQSASRMQTLASVFFMNFGAANASPLKSFDIFSAGIVWAAALALEPRNPVYSQSLTQCMGWLDELKPFWPSAKQHYDLLRKVSTSNPPIAKGSIKTDTTNHYQTGYTPLVRNVDALFYSPYDRAPQGSPVDAASNDIVVPICQSSY